jgi:pimeloyl-ACP methyl ester carboxylesterase
MAQWPTSSRRLSRFGATLVFQVAAGGAATAVAQDAAKPPVLKAEGSFYINGVVAPAGVTPATPSGTGTQIINQMYVQFRVPEKRHHRKDLYPVVMVHGSGHTGKTYETTPDGREGWQTYFVRRGLATYVVDQPGRARSSFDPTLHQAARMTATNPHGSPQLLRSLGGFSREAAWTAFRIGPTPFVPHPTTQFPVDAKDQYFAQLVPNTDAYLGDPATRINALAALLDKIGPAVVMVHSMSGSQGLGVAIARPHLVKAVVDVEPAGGGCAASQTTDALIASVFRNVPVLVVLGDFATDAFTTAILNTCKPFVDRINAAGGRARFLHLPEVGMFGNSHMLMLDRNNLRIADLILDWLNKNVN